MMRGDASHQSAIGRGRQIINPWELETRRLPRVELTVDEANALLDALDQEFVVEGARDTLRILDGPGGAELGHLRWRKSRIGLLNLCVSGGRYYLRRTCRAGRRRRSADRPQDV